MFDLGVVPFPFLSPESDDFEAPGLLCDIQVQHFDAQSMAVEFAYQFGTVEGEEQEYCHYLCDLGLAKRFLLIQSPESLYRESVPVGIEGLLTITGGVLYGRVKITPIVIAETDLSDYQPPYRASEWGAGPFFVGAKDVIAAGETVRLEISHKLSRRRPMIDLRLSNEMDPAVYRIDASDDVIVVNAGKDVRRAIEIMAKDPAYKPALFMSLYKDVLQEGLRQALESGGEQAWLRSLERHFGVDDINDLSEDDIWELPQKHLFNYGARKILENADDA